MPKNGTVEGSTAAVGFEYCNRLFAIEKDLVNLTPEQRKIQRQERSKPVLEAYWSWLGTVNVLKGSKLAEAITYSENQRTSLGVFLENGCVELSNNRAENAIRHSSLAEKAGCFLIRQREPKPVQSFTAL